jgi:cbb3-type cytochrome oxidase subunit 3
MIRNVLESIEGIGIFPTISLIIFMLAFVVMIVWVLRMDRDEVDKISRIPLDDDNNDRT